ncbi:MAG: inosine/xanthosine triphosphatase [Anaerolineae bacterium]|jgi:inosine/xanthosine triphosphatase
MKAVVGSSNPVKIAAARSVLRRAYGSELRIEACPVDSGISDQPWGDELTLQGALNRARGALQAVGASLGVGLEGGLVEVGSRVFTSAWCAVVSEDGMTGLAGGANLLLPPAVAEAVRAGAELGPAMDAFTGLSNLKHQEGAIGILTAGHLNRQLAYEHLLILALARLLTPADYDGA